MTQLELERPTVRCAQGHAIRSDAKYCDQCGVGVGDRTPGETVARRWGRRSGRVWVLGSLIAVATAAGVVGVVTHDAGPKKGANGAAAPAVSKALPIQTAYDDCGFGPGGNTLEVGDAGKTLIVDTQSEYGSIKGVVCVFAELGTSQALVASVSNTTAMMGMQTETDGTSNTGGPTTRTTG